MLGERKNLPPWTKKGEGKIKEITPGQVEAKEL